jgi:hypothetical protein
MNAFNAPIKFASIPLFHSFKATVEYKNSAKLNAF